MMYFDPKTQSPITLLELGIIAEKKPASLYLSCPKGFWRKGNVDIICDRYNIKTYKDFDDLLFDGLDGYEC